MSPTALLLALSLAAPGTPDGAVPFGPDAGADVPDASSNAPDASMGPADASFGTPDASVYPNDPEPVARPASLTLSPGAFVGAWTDTLRDDAFGTSRDRGADLWSNAWATGGGLAASWGRLVCPAATGEHFSEPRVAWADTHYVFLWRVARSGTPGHELRVATVSTSGVVDSCTTVFASAPRILAVQLAASGPQAYAVWETDTQVLGQLVGANNPTVLLTKDSSQGAARPTLAGLVSEFRVLWFEGPTLTGVSVTQAGQVSPRTDVNVVARHATVTGTATAKAAYVKPGQGGQSLEQYDLALPYATGQLWSTTADAPPLAAAAGTQLYAAHFPSDTATQAEVVQQGVSSAATLGAGVVPQAMASGALRAGLLAAEPGGWRVFDLPPLVSSSGPMLTPLPLARPAAWQQVPTAAWAGPDAWAVTWRDAQDNEAGGQLVRLDGGVESFPARPDVGVPRMVTATSGARLGFTLATDQETALYETSSAGLSTANATKRHSAMGAWAGAALGSSLAALWTPGGTSLSWARAGAVGTWSAPAPGRLGRCGAFFAERLWVPAAGVLTGSELSLLALDDAATLPSGTPPTTYTLDARLGASIESTCLSITGTRGLLAWVTNAGQLGLAFVDFSSGAPSLGAPLTLAASVSRVRDAVVGAVTGGWLVAWEAQGDRGSEILAMAVSQLGVVSAALPYSSGLDARSPWLAPAPHGQALLAFQQLAPEYGMVLVKTRVLGVASAADGGVLDGGTAPEDAGLPDAGPVDAGKTDAGVAPADGGVKGPSDGGADPNEPLTFTSCGCGADGASALVLLAVLALRRRSTRGHG